MTHTAEAGEKLLDVVKQLKGYASNTKTRNYIKAGSVRVDEAVVHFPNVVLKAGQVVRLGEATVRHKKARVVKVLPYTIYFEDDDILVFEKPAKVPTASKKVDSETAFSILKTFYLTQGKKDELRFVNKVDKNESGLVIVAKSEANWKDLITQWEEMPLKYYALVEGQPREADGTITTSVIKSKTGDIRKSIEGEKGMEITTKWRTMKTNQEHTLLKMEVMDEVKKQTRYHAQVIGSPVVGDNKFGAKTNPIKRLGLHLFSITFKHPKTGESMTVHTPVPKELLRMAKNRNK